MRIWRGLFNNSCSVNIFYRANCTVNIFLVPSGLKEILEFQQFLLELVIAQIKSL